MEWMLQSLPSLLTYGGGTLAYSGFHNHRHGPYHSTYSQVCNLGLSDHNVISVALDFKSLIMRPIHEIDNWTKMIRQPWL